MRKAGFNLRFDLTICIFVVQSHFRKKKVKDPKTVHFIKQ